MKRIAFAAIALMAALSGCDHRDDAATAVRISEVGFDPIGHDGERPEWIELYNPAAEPVDVGGLTLADEALRPIAVLPPRLVPANGYLVVLLGAGTDQGVYLWTGEAGNFLDNAQASLSLWDADPASGALLDYVAWSRYEPFRPGAGYARAVAEGRWPEGAAVELYTTGALPLLEGESLGRDGAGTDTDTAADWSDHGGADAFRTTPGAANVGGLLPSADAMKYAQVWINEALHDFGLEPRSAWADVIAESGTGELLTQELMHSFDVVDEAGAAARFVGGGTLVWTMRARGEWDLAFEVELLEQGGTRTIRASRAIAWTEHAGAVAYELSWDETLLDGGTVVGTRARSVTGSAAPLGAGGRRVELTRHADPEGTVETYTRSERPEPSEVGWTGSWSTRLERADGTSRETTVAYERTLVPSWENELLAGPNLNGVMNATYSTYDIASDDERWVLDGLAWEATHADGTIGGHVRWVPTMDRSRRPIEHDFSGAAEELRIDGRAVYHVELADDGGGTRSYWVDPLPADGGLTKAVLTVIGVVGTVATLASFVTGDGAAPTVTFLAESHGCDAASGWVELPAWAEDPREIGRSGVDPGSITVSATEDDGSAAAATARWTSHFVADGVYYPERPVDIFTVRISHTHYEAHEVTLLLHLKDNGGNGVTVDRRVMLPPRAECTPGG